MAKMHSRVKLLNKEGDGVEWFKPTLPKPPIPQSKQRFTKQIAVGLTLALGVLSLISLKTYESLTEFVETSQQVTQSYQTLELLDDTLSQLKDAETGQRGYIITGRTSYLEPYQSAIAKVKPNLKKLRNTFADNRDRQQPLNTLELLVDKKFLELQQTIHLRVNEGQEAAANAVLTDEGKRLMDRIRQVIGEIKKQENLLLQERSRLVETNARQTILTGFGGIFVTFLILAGVYYQIYREINKRQHVETLLKKERDFTCAVVDTIGALVVIVDSEGKIVRFNQTCEKITDYSFSEVHNQPFWDLFLTAEELKSVKDVFHQLRSGDFPNRHQNYWITRYGELRLINWSNTALLNQAGEVEYIIGTGIDITEQQAALKDRKQAQETMQRQLAAVEAAIDGIAWVDRHGKYTYLNQSHLKIFGYDSSEELIGKSWQELYPLDEIERFDRDVFPLLAHRKFWQGEAIGKRKDGSKFAEEVSLTQLEDGSFICVCRDIGDRKLTEERLIEQNLALEYAAEGISQLDAQGRYLAVNRVYADMTGYKPEELLGLNWETTVFSEDREYLNEVYQKMLSYGKAEAEARGIRKDGSIFSQLVTLVSSWDNHHNFIGYYCFAKDISDRKQLEIELQAREERFRVLVTHSPVGIFQTDVKGDCLFVNAKWSELTGLSIAEALGNGWVSAIHHEDRDRVLAEWFERVRMGEEFSMEYRLQTPQERVKWVDGRTTAVRDENGIIIGYFGSLTEFSDRKQAETHLEASLQEKEVLLKEVHHRVKNNLQVIDSLFRHQCRHSKDERLVQVLKECQNRVSSMALLHEKLYQSKDLARIDLGEYIQSLTVNLLDSYRIDESFPSLKINIGQIFLELEKALSCGLIINEIVSNSIKYAFKDGRKGKIRIQFFQENGDYKMIVGDNGIGLSPDFDLATTKTLGLKLVRSLVSQLDGEIDVDLSSGTQFIIKFPQEKNHVK